jgi:hypothetical protein
MIEWILGKFDAVDDERLRRISTWTLIVVSVCWPLSHALFLMAGETNGIEHFILALSWFAIWISAAQIIIQTDIKKTVDSDT